MIKSKIKILYNKILFKLYRGRDVDYEELMLGKFNRPFLFCNRLYSPSLYASERGKDLIKVLKKDLKTVRDINRRW